MGIDLVHSRRHRASTSTNDRRTRCSLSRTVSENGAPRSGERIEKLNFLLRAAEAIPNCALVDVPALVRF